jgi:hypothetical protein
VEGQPFIKGIQSLAKAVGAFFYLCFVAGLHYPLASFSILIFLLICIRVSIGCMFAGSVNISIQIQLQI